MDPLLARIAARLPRGVLPQWYEIRRGPHKQIRCSCGGRFIDKPHEHDVTMTIGVCPHLVALYGGHVTEDKRDMKKRTEYTYAPSTAFVQLTKAGEEMFRWRWAALALARD